MTFLLIPKFYGQALNYYPAGDPEEVYSVFYCVTEDDEKNGKYGKAWTIFLKRGYTSNSGWLLLRQMANSQAEQV